MAKFSLARQPYYIAVAIFAILSALVALINNTQATGTMSDVYLALVAICLSMFALSMVYLFHSKAGGDDEQGIEVAGLPMGKKYYYIAVLVMAAWRVAAGYQMNHSDTGIASTYGIIWLLSGLVIAVFTWANYRSYMVTHPEAR